MMNNEENQKNSNVEIVLPELCRGRSRRHGRVLQSVFEDETSKEIREDLEKRLQHWTRKVGDKGMATEYEAVDMFPEKTGYLKMPSQ